MSAHGRGLSSPGHPVLSHRRPHPGSGAAIPRVQSTTQAAEPVSHSYLTGTPPLEVISKVLPAWSWCRRARRRLGRW